MDKRIALDIDVEDYTFLKILAEKEERKIANLVRKIIKGFISARDDEGMDQTVPLGVVNAED